MSEVSAATTSVGAGGSSWVTLGWLAVRLASASFFSSLVTRFWDAARAAWCFFAFFCHRDAFASARSSLALSFLLVAFSCFSDDELFFFFAPRGSLRDAVELHHARAPGWRGARAASLHALV